MALRYTENKGRSFDDVEPALRHSSEKVKGKSRLTWAKAKHASRAGRAIPGDSDADGK